MVVKGKQQRWAGHKACRRAEQEQVHVLTVPIPQQIPEQTQTHTVELPSSPVQRQECTARRLSRPEVVLGIKSLESLVAGHVLAPFTAIEALPKPAPTQQVADRLEALLAGVKPSSYLYQILQHPHTQEFTALGWAYLFRNANYELQEGKVRDFTGRYESVLQRGEYHGEEPTRQGENAELLWEVAQLLESDRTAVGCILAANCSDKTLESSDAILRIELDCVRILGVSQRQKYPDLERLTVTIITFTNTTLRIVQAVSTGDSVAMQVTCTKSLDTLTGETGQAKENWVGALGWLLFRREEDNGHEEGKRREEAEGIEGHEEGEGIERHEEDEGREEHKSRK